MKELRPEEVLALLHEAGRSAFFATHLVAVSRLGPLQLAPRDIRHALRTVQSCSKAKEDPQILPALRLHPEFRELDPSDLWVACGNDLRGELLRLLVRVSPSVYVFYLWR